MAMSGGYQEWCRCGCGRVDAVADRWMASSPMGGGGGFHLGHAALGGPQLGFRDRFMRECVYRLSWAFKP